MIDCSNFAPPVHALQDRLDTTFFEACHQAEVQANESGLSMTVFIHKDTSGWWFTQPYASVLKSAYAHVTILPQNYFS